MRWQDTGRGQRFGPSGERLHPLQIRRRCNERRRNVMAEAHDDLDAANHWLGLFRVMKGMKFDGREALHQSVVVSLRIEVKNENLGHAECPCQFDAAGRYYTGRPRQSLPEREMTTERVAVRVSDAEMTRRWDAVRKLMKERGIQALVAYHTEDWLGGHARWFTDIPTHNGYGRTIVFHADDLMTIVQQGNFCLLYTSDAADE